MLVDNFTGDVLDIVSLIMILWKFHAFLQNLPVTQPCGPAQDIHLIADVIDVIFRLEVIPGFLKNIAQGIANRRATAMPNMKRTRWIGAHIFHQNFLTLAHRRTAEILTGFGNLHEPAEEKRTRHFQVDESRPRRFHPLDLTASVYEVFANHFGDNFRIFTFSLGKGHRKIRGEITQFGVLGFFNDDLRFPGNFQVAIIFGFAEG